MKSAICLVGTHILGNFFNLKTLTNLLEKEGFEIWHYETTTSGISFLNNYLDFQDPYAGTSENRKTLFGIIDADCIHQNLMGYKLLVTAQKF